MCALFYEKDVMSSFYAEDWLRVVQCRRGERSLVTRNIGDELRG